MPATACPNSKIAAVICSGLRTRAAGDDGAGAEGAIAAPKDASTPDAGAPDVWGSSADEDAGGGGWDELGGGPDMIEPEISDTKLIGTEVPPLTERRL
jgi:hypothetical protein